MSKKINKDELIDLNFAQNVPLLQCKYSLFKRVINILASMSTKEDLDFNLLDKAFNLVVERNDCLRISFHKDGKVWKQIFEKERIYNPVHLEFKTKEEQDEFIAKVGKKAIAWQKGVVIEPYFIKTFDGKSMVFFKVCHMILDMYGINIIYSDLFAVYNALKNGTELPEAPGSFEEVVKNDNVKKSDPAWAKKNYEYFKNLLESREIPYYAGIHGMDQPLWQKRVAKGNHSMKLFFIKNNTKGYMKLIDKETVDKVFKYCESVKQTPTNFLSYTMAITCSIMNNYTKNMSPLQLFNCRGTMKEKKCAGIKVQSLCTYTTVEKEKSFIDNFNAFNELHGEMQRHIGIKDMEFEMLRNKTYHTSLLNSYYSFTYSFIPFKLPEGMEFQIYSNGKCALPCYVAQLYDVDAGHINMAYDAWTEIINDKHVDVYHENYLKVINAVIDNPEIKIEDIKL